MMERVFAAGADLPEHSRWQIISMVRVERYERWPTEAAGPSGPPEAWQLCDLVGAEAMRSNGFAGACGIAGAAPVRNVGSNRQPRRHGRRVARLRVERATLAAIGSCVGESGPLCAAEPCGGGLMRA